MKRLGKISAVKWALFSAQAVLVLLCLKLFVFAPQHNTSSKQTGSSTASKLAPSPAPETKDTQPTAKIGRPAPDFTATGDKGEISLADYRGRPLLVEFIATWCPHCRKMAPIFSSVVREENFPYLVVGVAGEDLGRVANWHNNFLSTPMPGDYAVDEGNSAVQSYGIVGTPTTAVIDKNGRLLHLVSGEISAAALRQLLADIPR